jgi:hypothetical protein
MAFFPRGPLEPGRQGTFDFRNYWAIARSVGLGRDPGSVKSADPELSGPGQPPLDPVFQPAWVFGPLIPLTWVPFRWAALAWWYLSLGLLVVCTCALARGRALTTVTALALFTPAWLHLFMGQLTLMTLAGMLSAHALLASRRDLAAGLCLVTALFKPHVVFLWLIVLAPWIVRNRRYRVIVGLCAGTAALFLLGVAACPALLDHPFGHGAQAVTYLYPATIGAWIRFVIPGHSPLWTALPALLAAALCLVHARSGSAGESGDHAPPPATWMLLSCLFAPFGWSFDWVAILPVWLQTWERCEAGATNGGAAKALSVGSAAGHVGMRLAGLGDAWLAWWPWAAALAWWSTRPHEIPVKGR